MSIWRRGDERGRGPQIITRPFPRAIVAAVARDDGLICMRVLMYNNCMATQKPKRVYTHAFTCNLPVPFFEKLQKLASQTGRSIRDILVEAAERGLADER